MNPAAAKVADPWSMDWAGKSQSTPISASAHARKESLAENQLPINLTLHPGEQELELTARIAQSPGDASELARAAQKLIERSGFRLSGLVVNGRRIGRPSRRI